MATNPISSLVQQVTGDAHRIVSKSSDDVQSYANQLQLCRNMRQNLEELDGEILRITQAYHSALMQLEMEQYVDEELKTLARVLAEFAPQAEELSNHLRMRHMAYIEARAVQITEALGQAVGG